MRDYRGARITCITSETPQPVREDDPGRVSLSTSALRHSSRLQYFFQLHELPSLADSSDSPRYQLTSAEVELK